MRFTMRLKHGCAHSWKKLEIAVTEDTWRLITAAKDVIITMEERPHREAALHHGHVHRLSFALFFYIFLKKLHLIIPTWIF